MTSIIKNLTSFDQFEAIGTNDRNYNLRNIFRTINEFYK